MVVDQNHHGDQKSRGPLCHWANQPLRHSFSPQQQHNCYELKWWSAARKVNFSCPTMDWLPVERGIVGRQGAEALMLCGRWHRWDALPPGLMALLKITTPRLAAVCAFCCGFLSCWVWIFRPVFGVFVCPLWTAGVPKPVELFVTLLSLRRAQTGCRGLSRQTCWRLYWHTRRQTETLSYFYTGKIIRAFCIWKVHNKSDNPEIKLCTIAHNQTDYKQITSLANFLYHLIRDKLNWEQNQSHFKVFWQVQVKSYLIQLDKMAAWANCSSPSPWYLSFCH